MTDLHSRITAALLREDQLRVCKLSDADIKFMADAVIRELGNLRYEDVPDIAGEAWGIHRRIVSDSTFIPGENHD